MRLNSKNGSLGSPRRNSPDSLGSQFTTQNTYKIHRFIGNPHCFLGRTFVRFVWEALDNGIENNCWRTAHSLGKIDQLSRESRLCRTCGQNKDKSMFTGPILVFFQKYSQNRSKASKQCPMMTVDHQEWLKPPDPGWKQISEFHGWKG